MKSSAAAVGERDRWAGRVVLITGVGGFIGSAMAAELLRRGATVVGVIRDSAGMRVLESLAIHRRVQVVTGSIDHAGLVLRVLNEYDVDTVFHMAAQTQVAVAGRSPVPLFETNIAGTWTVLEAARQSPLVQRVVVASCDKAYRDRLPAQPARYQQPVMGLDPFEASKLCADVLAQSYATTFPLPVAVVRSVNVYGPGDLNWLHLIPGTIRSALSGSDPIVRSDGSPYRQYLFLDDAVDGYLSVAEHLPELSGWSVNLGTACSHMVIDVVRRILSDVGDAGLRPRILGEAPHEVVYHPLGYAETQAVTGWQPMVSLQEGIARTVRWYRNHLSSGKIVAFGAAR